MPSDIIFIYKISKDFWFCRTRGVKNILSVKLRCKLASIIIFKVQFWGFPGWYSGKESACQRRRHSFDHWSKKIPHAEEQLSTTTTPPVLQSTGATTTET